MIFKKFILSKSLLNLNKIYPSYQGTGKPGVLQSLGHDWVTELN